MKSVMSKGMTQAVEFFVTQGFIGQGRLPSDIANTYPRPSNPDFCCLIRDHLTVTLESVLNTFVLIKYRFSDKDANVTGFVEQTLNSAGMVILSSNSSNSLQSLNDGLASVIKLRAMSFWSSSKRPDYIGGYARD